MSIPEKHIWRFFVSTMPSEGEYFQLAEDEQSFAKVLRIRPHEIVEVTDGHGGIGIAKVVESNKSGVVLCLEARSQISKPKPAVSIFLGPAKMAAIERSVESAVELGLDTLYLVGLGENGSKLSEQKRNRIEKISREACRVSKRLWFCKIIFDVADWVEGIQLIHRLGAAAYVCDEGPLHERVLDNQEDVVTQTHRHLLRALQEHSSEQGIALLIGSESGFRQVEKKVILDASQKLGQRIEFVSLGNNILTVPNAVASAMAMTEICRTHSN